jgi:predicted transposase YbfD/YdcC
MILLMDTPVSAPYLLHCLSVIPDFRQSWKVQHPLPDILFLVVCAVICGSEGWDEIEDFSHSKLDFLRQYGNFTGGIPSHDTLARVMALINADQLQTAFAEWMKACHDVTDT